MVRRPSLSRMSPDARIRNGLRRVHTLWRRPTKRGLLVALGVIATAGFLLGGLAKVRIETSVNSFLPTDDPVVRQFEAESGSFGGDPIVVLLESGQPRTQLDQQHLPTLVKLEGELARLPDVAAAYGPGTTLNQIAGRTQDLLAELSGRRDAVRQQAQQGKSEKDAREAGDAAVAEFDARYGPLLVQGLPAGLPTLHNPSFVNTVVYTEAGQPRPQWRFVVPSDRAAAILVRPREGLDQQGTDRLVEAVRNAVSAAKPDAERITVSGVPVLAVSLGDQVQREIPWIGGVALLAVGACFLLIPWTARWRRRLVPVMTTVVAIGLTLAIFGWLGQPLSLGVIAFLPVLLGVGSYYPTYFVQQARRRVVLVVAAATAAAFAMLLLSPLPFVRELGLALSMGVLIAALVGMLLIRGLKSSAEGDQQLDETVDSPRAATSPRWARLAAGIVVGAVAVAGWVALPRIGLESNFQSFATGLDALADAQHVESVIGSSGEVAVVLRGRDVLAPEAMKWASDAQESIVSRHGDQMRPVVSPPTLLPFLGSSPTASQIAAGVRLLPPYLTGAVFRSDRTAALLSFGVRMEDLGELQALRDDVVRYLPPPPQGYHVDLTGLPMIAVRGNELVSADRLLTNLAGILAAGVVLLIALRRRADAMRAVVAAAVATGAGLCFLWGAGVPLSPITAGLGSLTAAVGCEFTVLLSEAARRRSRGLRLSILLAACTSTVGYAVLVLSKLAAVREFGILLAGSVVLALLSACCVVWLWPPRDRVAQTATPQSEPGERVVAEVGR
ncbi:MMPL family transporter [Amycolatopsis roodepoortensis]|uniref:MMPL family transporter n=1 Tax=Amycolatopsis roodepoortensis TaxID=700274 RepID=UPI00214C2AA3|nr:MMPL family transporter [Amycolatopsis roodepoortensis]UUV28637.1 MMPL family transporter [Amycolatopsis roodepoortensis]